VQKAALEPQWALGLDPNGGLPRNGHVTMGNIVFHFLKQQFNNQQ
jgi:hypothetical protein